MPFVTDIDLATALATALSRVVAPTSGATVFAGPVRPADPPAVPHEAIHCVPPVGSGDSRQTFRRAGKVRFSELQVRSRGERDDFDSAATLAESIHVALNNLTVLQVTGGLRYLAVLVSDGNPIMLGQDDQEHWEFVTNVEMTYDDG